MDFGISSRSYFFLFCFSLFCTFHLSVENETPVTEGVGDVFDFKVNVRRLKREVQTIPDEELSPLQGRTYRASEPLDPNSPHPAANPFEGFETVNTVFDPNVEAEQEDEEDEPDLDEDEDVEAQPNGNKAVQDKSMAAVADGDGEVDDEGGADDDNDAAVDDDNDNNEREYAAQYPYPQASGQYPSGGAQTPRRFYPGDLDPQRPRPYSGAQNQQYSPGVENQNQYPDGSSVYRQQTFVVGDSGNVNRGYQSGGSRRYVENSRERQVERGPRYDGEVLVDNQGHYIDAQGRHLDATGRYYDISGRYQDATVTRTTNYYNSAPAYTHSARGGVGNQYGQYAEGGTPSRSRGSPLDSYGGNQFYQTGSGNFPASYDPIVSQISDDQTCQETNVVVTINGLTCNNAVSQLGPYVCYNYERVSSQCCRRCLQVKRREREGCEYGDRSNQCRNIQPFNCYDDRNRQICCDRCRQFLEQRGHGVAAIFQSREQLISRCSYDDLTPRCQNIRQRPYLCYLPENQRLCCSVCPRLANNDAPSCKWGDQNPEVCQPFDGQRRLQLNCYLDAVKDICCATCKSLRERMPQQIAGCQYGDAPTLYRTGRGLLNCGQFIRQYGSSQCNNYQTSTKCCYTCHRYLTRRQRK